MTTTLPVVRPLTQEDSKALRIYYVIYSFDLTHDAEHMLGRGWLDPNGIPRHEGESLTLDGVWTQTEGDEQYDYDYLADGQTGPCRNGACANGAVEEEILVPRGWVGVGIEREFEAPAWSRAGDDEVYVVEGRPCPYCQGSGTAGGQYRNGYHRKYVAELTHAEYLLLAKDRCWDLDDDDRPVEFTETMGSITEHGHLPAIALDDNEGWSYGGEVIYASFYVTMGELPPGAACELRVECPDCEGLGYRKVGEPRDPGFHYDENPCPTCSGTGGLNPYTKERVTDDR